jgi:FkbM family methyltransferase
MRSIVSRFRPQKKQAPQEYKVGDYSITLPPGHSLPEYQATNRLYDRFPLALGHSKYSGWILDIGANIGDTLAALSSFNPKKIVCIEPDAEWFQGLQKMADIVRRSGSTVVCIREAIGQDGSKADLTRTGTSTAYFDPSETGGTKLKSLDSVIAPIISDEDLSLIKCDVDGHDAAVLASGKRLITEHLPLLYVEAEVRNPSQMASWAETLSWLADIGYDTFAAIDNFGLPLLRNAGPKEILDCLRYTLDLNTAASTRTSWYFDLFATTAKRKEQFQMIMQGYDEKFIQLKV